jgi:hypothetical protein
VTASPAKNQALGTGRWRVFAEGSTPTDSKVREGDVLHFLNGYDDWKGGFLDTANAGPAPIPLGPRLPPRQTLGSRPHSTEDANRRQISAR